MALIPKKVIDRYKSSLSKFQKVLEVAKDRDINEADTVSIIQDILAEVFGYEKIIEITSEYAIRGTYCDLAIKIDEKIQYLIEVKAIGLGLSDKHLKQAVDYGANKGVPWVILTNGISWSLYKIKFEQPIDHELVLTFDFSDLNYRKSEDQEKLFALSKEGISKSVREDYYERVQNVNRFVIGGILLGDAVLKAIRLDLRRLSSGIKVDEKEILRILKGEVLKRDVIESEEAIKANHKLKRIASKPLRNKSKKNPNSKSNKPDKVENDEDPSVSINRNS